MRALPLLLLPLLLYTLVVFGGQAAGQPDIAALLRQSFAIAMPSGAVLDLAYGDIFLGFSLLLLLAEMVKATRTGRHEILNHALSTLVFIAALMAFLLLKGFATGVFALLTAMTLFDVLAGYTISIVSARRDLTVPGPE